MTTDERVRTAADAIPESLILFGMSGERKIKWVAKVIEASGYPAEVERLRAELDDNGATMDR